MLSFKLFENIQQAKKLLQDKKVKDFTDYNKISNLLSKNPNYIYQFTKWRYVNNVSMEDIEKTINTIVSHKNVVDLLSKNIIDYTNFEHLTDDLRKASFDSIVNQFLTNAIWYKSLRNDLKKYIKSNPEKSNSILDFIKLDETLQKEFLSTLKYYQSNNVDADSFFDELENFIGKKSLKDNELIKRIEDKGDLLKVVYNNDNVIIISTRDKDVVKEFGSQKWCIVYSDSFFGKYIGSVATQQYICFNLNIPKINFNSLFGITVYPGGKTVGGARQNSNNDSMDMADIIKSLNVGADVFKPLNDEELSKLPATNLISSGIVSKLTEKQISSLDVKTKIKHKLLKDDEIKDLDPMDKVIHGYIEYLTIDEINSLPNDIIEKYELPLSIESIKNRDFNYKVRNGYFNLLTNVEIGDINELLSNTYIKSYNKEFTTFTEVEDWYKSLNLIDKLEILIGDGDRIDYYNFFIGKRDLIPFEDKYELELSDDEIDEIRYNQLEDFAECDKEIYYNGIVNDIGLSTDYAYSAIVGEYSVEYDQDELNYIHYYINKDNLSEIESIFGLDKYELEVFGTKHLFEYFLNNRHDLLYYLADDSNTIGNNEIKKFEKYCPIIFNGDQITIDFDNLLDYLIDNDKKEFKNLYDWANSGELFDSDKVDFNILNEYTPTVDSETAISFNEEFARLLNNYDVDETTKIPKELIKLGFCGQEQYSISTENKNGDKFGITDISINKEEETALFTFTKNGVNMSGDLDYLKSSFNQQELF